MKEYSVSTMGAIAAETLESADSGSVIGITSKGAFLRTGDRILFLTSADYSSPFNMILTDENHWLAELQPGDLVVFRNRDLYIPGARITINTDAAEIWTPPAPALLKTSIKDQLVLAERWSENLRRKDPEKGFLFLANESNGFFKSQNDQETRNSVRSLVDGFKQEDFDKFMSGVRLLLGRGGGLTPSGDDLVTGFFLYHMRFDQSTGRERLIIPEWLSQVTQLAFERTTTISANRLAAARRGWSEELFLKIIDALFDPAIKLDGRFFERLISFGHSSGVDTFMGIYFGLKSLL